MNSKSIKEINSNKVVRKRLARIMSRECFRDTKMLEELHTGKSVVSETGDYSDVVVKMPSRKVPWNEISRFNDEEMKKLMTEVTNLCYDFITEFFSNPRNDRLIQELKTRAPYPDWRKSITKKLEKR